MMALIADEWTLQIQCQLYNVTSSGPLGGAGKLILVAGIAFDG